MKKLVLFGAPIIFVALVLAVNVILDLLRQPSDIALLSGLFLTSVLTYLVYTLSKKVIQIFKTK